ncbi:hypothetical protein T440DRAFT_140525 [Plenodomus tracheiphilus IPT5]|uniref:Uncharacterized protein n=1 Tax=Plenodomus tracheiphilus IPT5 TaxID=1408161 RepID=A0A6A7B126_9PLEO|nr:hypothetical protein T440DRAFT_140525 [Plenodomus tracheiphilus IPT5]
MAAMSCSFFTTIVGEVRVAEAVAVVEAPNTTSKPRSPSAGCRCRRPELESGHHSSVLLFWRNAVWSGVWRGIWRCGCPLGCPWFPWGGVGGSCCGMRSLRRRRWCGIGRRGREWRGIRRLGRVVPWESWRWGLWVVHLSISERYRHVAPSTD